MPFGETIAVTAAFVPEPVTVISGAVVKPDPGSLRTTSVITPLVTDAVADAPVPLPPIPMTVLVPYPDPPFVTKKSAIPSVSLNT